MLNLSTFLVGLREGLEASLVVGILVAYLVRAGRRDRLRPVWGGVAAAVVLSLAAGAALELTSASLGHRAQEAFGGVASLLAVAFVTWMVFWMRRTARTLRGELHGRLDTALAVGPLALAATGFLAVGREGLETAVFLWSAAASSDGAAGSTVSALAGITAATGLGWLVYRGAVTLDLRRFFTWTGAALVVVAAGVVAYGVHDLQEAGWLPGESARAFDVSDVVPRSSWYGSLLKGTVGFQPDPTVLQVAVWLAYLVPVLVLFLRPGRPTAQPT